MTAGEEEDTYPSPTEANTKRQIMDQASLKEHETRRIKVDELELWCVKPKVFLGRGSVAKWFVLHQALGRKIGFISIGRVNVPRDGYSTTWLVS